MDNKNNRPDLKNRTQNIFELVRGIMYISVGVFCLVSKNLKQNIGEKFAIGFAIICFLYGLFRLWRFYIGYINSKRNNHF